MRGKVLVTLLIAVFATGVASAQTASDTFTVTIEVAPNCTISASDIDFGSYNSTLGNVVTTLPPDGITVNCVLGTIFEVGLDGGTVSGDVADREMENTSSPGDTIDYSLICGVGGVGGCLVNWGNTTGVLGDTSTGIGTGLDQNIAVIATVLGQGGKRIGTYEDTVTATVFF